MLFALNVPNNSHNHLYPCQSLRNPKETKKTRRVAVEAHPAVKIHHFLKNVHRQMERLPLDPPVVLKHGPAGQIARCPTALQRQILWANPLPDVIQKVEQEVVTI